jgi:hypothetical protein
MAHRWLAGLRRRAARRNRRGSRRWNPHGNPFPVHEHVSARDSTTAGVKPSTRPGNEWHRAATGANPDATSHAPPSAK